VNRYAAVTACSVLLALSACRGGDAASVAASQSASQSPIVPTPTAATTPTAKPTADLTAAAKTKILGDYAYYHAFVIKGAMTGGVSYPYEHVMTGAALDSTKRFMSATKGLRGVKYSGQAKLLKSRVSTLSLQSRPATATVISCILDNVIGTDKTGKRVVTPAGKISTVDKVKLVNGRWMIYSSAAKNKSIGCT